MLCLLRMYGVLPQHLLQGVVLSTGIILHEHFYKKNVQDIE